MKKSRPYLSGIPNIQNRQEAVRDNANRHGCDENLKQRAHKDAKILADAQALAEKIANLPLTIAMKAEEGKIFGSVTAADLAEALAAKGVELDRKTITVEAIKNVGEYEASAKLHREVKATIKFTVVAEE